MQPRLLILSVSGALVFLALVYLRLEVGAAPAAVDADKISDAKARAVVPPAAADPWADIGGASGTERPVPPRRPMAAPRPATEGDSGIIRPALRAESVTDAAPPRLAPGADPDLEASNAMDEANRLFDRGDYEGAQGKANEVLATQPGNARMLRILTSTACFMGEPDKAQKAWLELSERDRVQMSTRCARYGIEFKP